MNGFWSRPTALVVVLWALWGCSTASSTLEYANQSPNAIAFVCRHFQDGSWKSVPVGECSNEESSTYRLFAYTANGPTGQVSITDLYAGTSLDMDLMIPGTTALDIGTYVQDIVARNASDRVIALDPAELQLVFIDPADRATTVFPTSAAGGHLELLQDDATLLISYPGLGKVGRLLLDEQGLPEGDEELFDVGGTPWALMGTLDGRIAVGHQFQAYVTLLDATTMKVVGAVGLVAECMDGLDNDQDGLVDRDDPQCMKRSTLREAEPADCTENCTTVAACSDGVDNDEDGLTDLDDPGCIDRMDGSEWTDLTPCKDGVDNDGDGKTDFPDDTDCASPDSSYESPPILPEGIKTQCDNGRDDDGDGLVDLDDPDCVDAEGTETGATVCSNGMDDDGDGFTDYPDDPDCFGAGDSSEGGSLPPMTRFSISPDGEWLYALHHGDRTVVALNLTDMTLVDVNSVDDSADRRIQSHHGRIAHRLTSPPVGVSFLSLEDTLYAMVSTEDAEVTRYVVQDAIGPVHQIEQAPLDEGEVPFSLAKKPTLFVGSEEVKLGYSPAPGYPNLGPLLVETDEVSGARTYYGISFNEDVRAHRNETWYVEFEGNLPGTGGMTARVAAPDRIVVASGNLCELGALPGDWFGVLQDGVSGCTDYPADSEFSFLITNVGQDYVELDPSTGHLWLDGEVQEVSALNPACFPEPLSFKIRPRNSALVWGSRTGFLHNVITTSEGCRVDPEGDPLFSGRAYIATVEENVEPPSCPIIQPFEGLVPETFQNPILSFNLYPACAVTPEGAVQIKAPIRDTAWRFQVISGFVSNTITAGYLPVYQTRFVLDGLVYLLDLAGLSIKAIDFEEFSLKYSYY